MLELEPFDSTFFPALRVHERAPAPGFAQGDEPAAPEPAARPLVFRDVARRRGHGGAAGTWGQRPARRLHAVETRDCRRRRTGPVSLARGRAGHVRARGGRGHGPGQARGGRAVARLARPTARVATGHSTSACLRRALPAPREGEGAVSPRTGRPSRRPGAAGSHTHGADPMGSSTTLRSTSGARRSNDYIRALSRTLLFMHLARLLDEYVTPTCFHSEMAMDHWS